MSLRPSRIERAYTGSDWLDLATAKAHLRVDWSDDDTSIQTLIDESSRAVESYLNRPVRDTTLTLTWGPVSVAPPTLIAPYVEPGATVTSLEVVVGSASGVAQAYVADPVFDRDLRELTFELEDTPSVDGENRATWTAVLALDSDKEYRQAAWRARLLYIGEMHEVRMGPASWAAMHATLDPFRVVP
jgi:hypothetical protein